MFMKRRAPDPELFHFYDGRTALVFPKLFSSFLFVLVLFCCIYCDPYYSQFTFVLAFRHWKLNESIINHVFFFIYVINPNVCR